MLRLLDQRFANNAYAVEIDAALPRLLAMSDRDPLSRTCGFGDRRFWAWKLTDFANGTLQGTVNGLTALLRLKAFGSTIDPERIIAQVNIMLQATPRLMRGDGSFEEALPYEQSYCVTALVLYDYLCAVERLEALSSKETWQASLALAPAVDFLLRRDETHGFISNHLATAAAALLRWDRLHDDAKARKKAKELLARIVDRQSGEGWFDEYGGADPGYQTLCMTHLADAEAIAETHGLQEALQRGTQFLSYFAHPDGSFGGIYGSRATRIYYPAAAELLRERIELAGTLADWMRPAIRKQATVTLSAIDTPNLSPVFNNYCQALLANQGDDLLSPFSPAPVGRSMLTEAGLLVDVGPRHHSVISTRKAVICHWHRGKKLVDDCGLAFEMTNGGYATSQGDPDTSSSLESDRLIIQGRLSRRKIPLPNPYNMLVLRLLSVTVMRVPRVAAVIKQMIAGLLVEARGKYIGKFRREITLGPELHVRDSWEPRDLSRISINAPFSVIHMASSGYWQKSDTEASES